MNDSTLKVGLAQIAPVWLNKLQTIAKIKNYLEDAAAQDCELVIFGESLLPGYPFWLSLIDGAKFNDPVQKEIHAHYLRNAVEIEKGDLADFCALAKKHQLAIYLGIIERAENRGGHSLYCSLVYIDAIGIIQSVHRKLQPTYEERLTWAPGDGHGLSVHPLKNFRLGGLNCWENWMPLSRTALYAQGENLHVAVWPGMVRNTIDLTRFIAVESRSFVISVSGLMRPSDFPKDTPHLSKILAKAPEYLANGGSCIAGPDGNWIIEPVAEKEILLTATLDLNRVWEERQNFDPAGHYSRPDVTKLILNKERQSILKIENND
ncbi:MAG: carbon-nitrogen hydrolase family protein [Saprospiraceae bacterium]